MENKLNIERFFNGLAKALTIQYEKEYPGLVVTVKDICKKDDAQERECA